jgi:hypothetical protein
MEQYKQLICTGRRKALKIITFTPHSLISIIPASICIKARSCKFLRIDLILGYCPSPILFQYCSALSMETWDLRVTKSTDDPSTSRQSCSPGVPTAFRLSSPLHVGSSRSRQSCSPGVPTAFRLLCPLDVGSLRSRQSCSPGVPTAFRLPCASGEGGAVAALKQAAKVRTFC